jgi:hypothetical protein
MTVDKTVLMVTTPKTAKNKHDFYGVRLAVPHQPVQHWKVFPTV